jgi:hypothetical protein
MAVLAVFKRNRRARSLGALSSSYFLTQAPWSLFLGRSRGGRIKFYAAPNGKYVGRHIDGRNYGGVASSVSSVADDRDLDSTHLD